MAMFGTVSIRAAKRTDIPSLKQVLIDADLYAPEMLIFDDENGKWILAQLEQQVIGLAYYKRELLTAGTWNLLCLAVSPEFQRIGVGSKLVAYVENELREGKERLLIIETSNLPDQDKARKLYKKLGYELEATIRDFWNAGEDKLVYRKML